MKNRKLRARIVETFGTASDFAAYIGVRESIVSRVVCGRRTLTPEKQKAWATALKCKPSEIFTDLEVA